MEGYLDFYLLTFVQLVFVSGLVFSRRRETVLRLERGETPSGTGVRRWHDAGIPQVIGSHYRKLFSSRSDVCGNLARLRASLLRWGLGAKPTHCGRKNI